MDINKIYQEPNSTFMNNGKIHDLNYIFKHTVNERIVYVDLNELKWQLEFMPKKLTIDDRNRISKVNLDIPGLLIKYNDEGIDRLLIVDGYHRLLKGIQENKKSLPYKFVPDKVMNDSIIGYYNPDKKINVLIQNIKNPKELLQWMENNLKYESKVKGYLRTPEQVIEDKKAHCWEATDLEHVVLNQLGYSVESLYIENPNCTVTHTAAIYSHHNEYYWFEWAWKKHAGIHKFKSFEELVEEFSKCFIEEYGNYSAFVKTRSLIITKDCDETSVVEHLSKLTTKIKVRNKQSTESFNENKPAYLKW